MPRAICIRNQSAITELHMSDFDGFQTEKIVLHNITPVMPYWRLLKCPNAELQDTLTKHSFFPEINENFNQKLPTYQAW